MCPVIHVLFFVPLPATAFPVAAVRFCLFCLARIRRRHLFCPDAPAAMLLLPVFLRASDLLLVLKLGQALIELPLDVIILHGLDSCSNFFLNLPTVRVLMLCCHHVIIINLLLPLLGGHLAPRVVELDVVWLIVPPQSDLLHRLAL